MKAIDKVTINIEYNRPHFEFPDLSGPDGNPMVYWPMAIKKLASYGFIKEAREIPNYTTMSYKDQFNYLAQYLDFSEKNEILSEDDEHVYIKVKKDEVLSKTCKQLPLFQIQNRHKLEELYLNGYDLTVTNCYNRNILHYLDDHNTLKFMLEKNQEENWFDLFDLDNFKKILLSAHINKLENFNLVLSHMIKQNKELTPLYLRFAEGNNPTPLELYTYKLDHTFNLKNATDIDIDEWDKYIVGLKLIKSIVTELFSMFLELTKKIPLINKVIKEKDTNSDIYKLYQRLKLEVIIEEKENSYIKPKKI